MILASRKREHIMPMPVVLISTVSGTGVKNAAPWSNIAPILRPFDDIVLAAWTKRDTLLNIRATKEFVINVPAAGMAESVMICSKNFPPEVDEFAKAGLRARPSNKIKPPGVEGCLAWAECVLKEEIVREKYSLVIGTVVHLEVDDGFFNEAGEMDFGRAMPLSVMLGDKGFWFTRPVYAGRYADYSEMFLSREERITAD